MNDVKDKLRLIINEKIKKGRIKESNIGDIIRALEYLDRDQCNDCEWKLESGKPKRTIDDALKEYLERED